MSYTLFIISDDHQLMLGMRECPKCQATPEQMLVKVAQGGGRTGQEIAVKCFDCGIAGRGIYWLDRKGNIDESCKNRAIKLAVSDWNKRGVNARIRTGGEN